MPNFQLGDDQYVILSLGGTDRRGNPVPPAPNLVTTAPEWSCTDPSVLQLTPAPDGMTCKVEARGPVNGSQAVIAKGILAAGDVPFTFTFDLDVVPSAAVGLTITAGVPQQA